MSKEIIHTDDAPNAVGPYSQAVRAGGFIFTAGQIALDPATGTMVQGDVSAQAERVLRNLQAVLAAAGASLEDVVKTTIFLSDMADFQAVNKVYASFFAENPPARSTVAVANLPLGALVEIECVAVVRV